MQAESPRSGSSPYATKGDPYYLYAPDFRQHQGGVRALHYLCHALNERGYEAYICLGDVTSPYLNTRFLTNSVLCSHYLSGKTPIAVYPEVAADNPLAAPVCARWLLNRPGHLGGNTAYKAEDLIYYYDDWCLPSGMSGTLLHIPTTDTRVFNNDNNPHDEERIGTCYYANKYLLDGSRVPAELVEKSISVGLEIPRSHEELAEIFRKSRALYCFEQSAIIHEALACGCPVVAVASAHWNPARSLGADLYGIVFTDTEEELCRARKTLSERPFADYLARAYQFSGQTIDVFINQTQAACAGYRSKTRTQENAGGRHVLDPWALSEKDRRLRFADFVRRYSALALPVPDRHEKLALPTSSDEQATTMLFAERASNDTRLSKFLVIIVHEAPGSESALLASLASVARQNYRELRCVVVSARPLPVNVADARVSFRHSADNVWQSVSELIGEFRSGWTTVIRSGDSLAEHAIDSIAEAIRQKPDWIALQADTREERKDGGGADYLFYPADCIDVFRAGALRPGLLVARSESMLAAGGWRELPRGLDELDLALRLFEVGGAAGFGHLAGALLHRPSGNVPLSPEHPAVCELRTKVVEEHLLRSGIDAVVCAGMNASHVRVAHRLPRAPKITVIVPTKDNCSGLAACIEALIDKSDYPDLEVLIIDNGSTEPSARAYIDNLTIAAPDYLAVASFAQPFNLATICNAAADLAKGELLVFLHDDVEALQSDWLSTMASLCLQPGVAIVGARLLSLDGKIQEAGIVPMQVGLAGNSFAGESCECNDATGRLQTAHAVSAISSACMMVRRDVYMALGGMDAQNFSGRVADIDFCMKARAAGHKIMWTPYASLLHDSDGTTRGNKHDNNALLAKWGKTLVDDPCFNPYLAIDNSAFTPETDAAFLPDLVNWHPLPNIYASVPDSSALVLQRIREPIREATGLALIRGRVGGFLPLPVQLKRLNIDVVHCPAPLTTHQLREVALYRQLLDCRVVLDIDTLVAEPFNADDPLRHIRSCLRESDRHIDRFVTASAWLASQLPMWTKKITVAPDTISRTRWDLQALRPEHGGKIRIGWHGQPADLETIASVVHGLAHEVDWVFIGTPPAALMQSASERHQAVSHDDFPEKLASLKLDLAILPLAMTVQNRCRSHLPALEYGALGIPVIATDIEAFQTGLPITLVDNTAGAWEAAIREQLANAGTLRERGKTLKAHVFDHWTFEKRVDQWRALWES